MMPASLFCRATATLGLAALLAGPAWADLDGRFTELTPLDAAVVAQGQALYSDHCAACHGDNLQGQATEWWQRDADGYLPAPPHDANGHTWHHSDDLLFEIVKYGTNQVIGDPDYRNNMGAFGDQLSDAEIIAVLSYIKSTWPEKIRTAHDERNAMERSILELENNSK